MGAYRKRHRQEVDGLWEGDPEPPTRKRKINPQPIKESPLQRTEQVIFVGDSWHAPCRHCGEGRHDYFVNGERYKPSATTFIGRMFNEFNPEKMAPQIAGRSYPADHYYHGLDVKQIIKRWKSSSADGTAMHENFENYFKGKPYYDDTVEFSLFQKFLAVFLYIVAEELGIPEDVIDDWELIAFDSEARAMMVVMRLIGTVDMLFVLRHKKTGQLRYIMVDWKRVYGLFRWFGGMGACSVTADMQDTKLNHYRMQLMLYKMMLEYEFDIEIEAMFVACFHPEDCRDNDNTPIVVHVEADRNLMNKMAAYRMRQVLAMRNDPERLDVDPSKIPPGTPLEEAYPHDCKEARAALRSCPWVLLGN